MERQLTFNDMLNAQSLNNCIINEIYKLRETLLKIDAIELLPNQKQLSDFCAWRADVFSHINKIIFDYSKNDYR